MVHIDESGGQTAFPIHAEFPAKDDNGGDRIVDAPSMATLPGIATVLALYKEKPPQIEDPQGKKLENFDFTEVEITLAKKVWTADEIHEKLEGLEDIRVSYCLLIHTEEKQSQVIIKITKSYQGNPEISERKMARIDVDYILELHPTIS